MTEQSPDLSTSIEKRVALTEVPIIDMSPFCDHGDSQSRQRTAMAIREACINIGFFYIKGHGFETAELDTALRLGHQFFNLPLEEKMRIAARNSDANLGFIQTGGLDPDSETAINADRKERLYLARELAPGELLDSLSPAGKAQWLPDVSLPGFRAAFEDQTARKVVLARRLAQAFSLSLGLKEDFLESFHDRLGCIHSLNFYPAVNPDVADRLWGFSPHTDYGTFTILHQDGTGGLQAQNAAGDWIDVPPVPGTFVINVGDLLMRWTNDAYISTLHRVRNLSPNPRLSVSFFAYPNPRAEIVSLEDAESNRSSRYEPVVAAEYIRQLLTQAYQTGRTGVSARTAERLVDG